jgi:hypothetical protein
MAIEAMSALLYHPRAHPAMPPHVARTDADALPDAARHARACSMLRAALSLESDETESSLACGAVCCREYAVLLRSFR